LFVDGGSFSKIDVLIDTEDVAKQLAQAK